MMKMFEVGIEEMEVISNDGQYSHQRVGTIYM